MLDDRPFDRGPLESAEVLLAGVDEDVGDGAALGRLDVGVGVPRGRAPGRGEQGGDCRLARAHRADEHHDGSGHRHLNLSVSR